MCIAMECTNHNREQKWNLLDSPNQGKKRGVSVQINEKAIKIASSRASIITNMLYW